MSKFVSGVSKMVVRSVTPLCLSMIWIFITLWFILNKSKRRKLWKGLGRQKELKLVMVTSHIQGPMDMVVLDSDKAFPVKVPPMLLLSSTRIECLTLSLNEEMVVDLHCLLVLSVERSMRTNISRVPMLALVVVRWTTR